MCTDLEMLVGQEAAFRNGEAMREGEGGWGAMPAVVFIVGGIGRGVLTVLSGGAIKIGAPGLGARGGRWGDAPGWFSCRCRTTDPGYPPPA